MERGIFHDHVLIWDELVDLFDQELKWQRAELEYISPIYLCTMQSGKSESGAHQVLHLGKNLRLTIVCHFISLLMAH
jgi:hypothetical protein